MSVMINSRYNVKFDNVERLQDYMDKGFVMLPKHQSNWDIPLEGMLLKQSIGRYGNYVMKDSLPKVLQYLGGLS